MKIHKKVYLIKTGCAEKVTGFYKDMCQDLQITMNLCLVAKLQLLSNPNVSKNDTNNKNYSNIRVIN